MDFSFLQKLFMDIQYTRKSKKGVVIYNTGCFAKTGMFELVYLAPEIEEFHKLEKVVNKRLFMYRIPFIKARNYIGRILSTR